MKINATRIISTLAVILAPVGTAWVVIASAIEKPAWPMHWLVALAVGASIEINGYSTTDLLLTLLRYNDTKKRKSDPSAPTGLAWTLLVVYFASVVTLTILVEVLPTLKQWRAVVFPVMSLAAFAVPVLRSKHERMLREIEEDKAEKKAEAARLKEERKAKEKEEQERNSDPYGVKVVPLAAQEPTGTRGKVLAFFRENPYGTQTACASDVKVSRQRVGQIIAELEAEKVITKNGKVKVIQ